MNKTERNNLINELSELFNTEKVLINAIIMAYEKKMSAILETPVDARKPVPTGIVGFDGVTIFPGLTLVYGMDSTGKSSLAKRIARSMHEQGLSVLFVEADAKRTDDDIRAMPGVFHTEDTSGKSIHAFLSNRLIDVVIFDSLTALIPATQRYLLHHSMKTSPYIIGVTQMRYNTSREMILPAVPDTVSSLARVHLYTRDPVPVNIDGVDMVKTYVDILKHPHPDIKGCSREMIIYGNIVHNALSAYHALHMASRISTVGLIKYVDSHQIGGIHEIITREETSRKIVSLLWPEEQCGNLYSSDPVFAMPERRRIRGAAYISAHRL